MPPLRLSVAEIHARADALIEYLSPCRLCPHQCGVERTRGETGICGLNDELIVFCTNLHWGEEPPITGTRGSGTVFFSGCNLRCVFCQNFAFSHRKNGIAMSPEVLADKMCALQAQGAHNVNWVTATPQLPGAVRALAIARENGLTLPLVYNCGGYESCEILSLLEGIVDIYLPDAKYASEQNADCFSSAANYPTVNRAALAEMYRQVGALTCNQEGIATHGMLVRHLVLPDDHAGTRDVLAYLCALGGKDMPMSVMRQYFPTHRAQEFPAIARRITDEEYEEALTLIGEWDMTAVFIQD